jgi:protein farnesyltransferase subunit beta
MTTIHPSSCLAHTLVPMPTDDLVTDTSNEQVKTEQEIRQLLSLYIPQPQVGNAKPKAAVLDVSKVELNRAAHVRWLTGILSPLPAPYTTLDASRPWLLYWVTHSLAIMNTSLDHKARRRAIATIKSFWNDKTGGFGGGPGQMAHLAPTYASVSALAYLDDGTGAAWDWIDR